MDHQTTDLTNTGNLYELYLQGGGEMGELIRKYDWASTSIGSPEHWPQSLLISLSILLKSKFPQFLWWGEDLIQFYNDAYRPSLGNNGKHPTALGQNGEECWQEIWDFIHPLIRQVLDKGEATWNEDQLLPIYRNGKLEDVYWTFSYSPIPGITGKPEGILVTCVETTNAVLSLKEIEKNESRFRSLVEQAPVATCMLAGRSMKIEVANEKMLNYWGKDISVIGKTLKEALPELEGQPYLDLLDQIYTSGISLEQHAAPAELEVGGKLSTYYFDLTYKPLVNTNGEVYAIMVIAVDLTEQVTARKALEESEERFRTMAEGTDALIAVSDETAKAIYFNKAWTRLTGRNMQELLMHGWTDLIHPGDKERYINAFLSAFKKREPFSGEFRIMNKEGEYCWLLAKVPVRFRPGGSFAGYISSCIDVTRQKELSQALEQKVEARTNELAKANHQLQLSNTELNQFAYIASHDLQEPLRKVRSFLGLMEDNLSDISPKTREYIDRMHKSTGRMQTLINDVLSFSQLSNERQNFVEVNLDDIFKKVIGDYELMIEQKGALITAAGLPVIEGVKVQMNQLFTNLLSNALKFSVPDKKPEIHVTAKLLSPADKLQYERLQNNSAYYRIEFTDNGIGFSQEHASQIFIIFQRLHGKNDFEGTGIGLALCKKIVQSHHGSISAISELNKGTTFVIIMPEKQQKQSVTDSE